MSSPSSVIAVVRDRVAREPGRLPAILDEVGEPLVAFDARRLIVFANEAAERYFGRARGELTNESVDVLVPARLRQPNAPPPAVTTDIAVVELPALRRDGTEVTTVWSFGSVDGSEPVVFVLHVREHSRVIAELETTTYAAVFEASPVPIALSRVRDAQLVMMNQAFATLFEVRREDFIGRTSTDLGIASPEQRVEIGKILAERGAVREFECERRTATGKTIFVALSVTPVRIGGEDHLLSTVQDISVRKTQEAALKETSTALADSRARADYAVRLSGIGFWYCDLPFDELAWDAKVKEHFFLPPDARVTIDTFYERIVPDDRERTRVAIDTAIAGRSLYDITYRTHHPQTGDLKWIRAMGGSAYAPDGTPIRFDGVTVDVTPQKRDEERFAATAAKLEEANRVKDDFLAMLGHELRNPLSPITTAVELMRLRGVEGREVDTIERQAQHLTRLVDDLLDVSRITRGNDFLDRHPCEMAEIVHAAADTVTALMESARHDFRVDVPEQGLVVDVDRHRMVQVISNLLVNAAKYTPPGGRIRVEAHREGTDVVVRVEDTGEGIPEDLRDQVFDMFVQGRQTISRSQGGLGLGLAIVKSLVIKHGGRVSVESAGPGRGSTFTVRLPSASARPDAAAAARPAAGDAVAPKRILVVDDNVDGADMMTEALRALGHETATAYDAAGALEIAAAFEPDVALMDIGLPDVDGYELARRMREKRPLVSMIAITGYGQPDDVKRSREAGFQEHVTKPVDLARLSALLGRLEAAR